MRTDRGANRGSRFDQHLGHVLLRFAVPRNSNDFDLRLVWQFACEKRQQSARFSAMHVAEHDDLQQPTSQRRLRLERFFELRSAHVRSKRDADDFGVGEAAAEIMWYRQGQLGGVMVGCFLDFRFPIIENENDIGRLTFEVVLYLSGGGGVCTARIED